jgi:hypothetical protein
MSGIYYKTVILQKERAALEAALSWDIEMSY